MSKVPSVHGEEMIDDCPLGNFIDVEAVPSPPPKMGHALTAKKGRLHRLEVVSALSQPGVDKLKEAWDRSHARGPVEEGVHAVFARPIPARVTRFVAIEADQSAFQMYSSSVLAGTCDQSPQRKDLRAPFMALCHWKEFWLLYGRSTCREAPCPSL